VIVNRKELLGQSSSHLRKWNVPHGIIAPSLQESRAYKIHVVSKDTLIRRYDKIKNWPDLLIFDEAHLYLDRQHEIISHLPAQTKIIGMTATPERMDGRGLSEVYETLIEGPSIPWLTDRGFLSPLRYFAPPIDGLADIHTRGTEYDEEELEALLERRKIYGELVGHYEKHGKGRAALIFCRSVKSAYQTAERFRDKGFNFHCIEGKMPDTLRRDLIAALTAGTIDGLTNCEIATYGLDIPRVEYGASIRPTLSRALYFQMIGRILRPFEGKQDALFFDHVNLLLEHQEPDFPGIPPHYVPEIKWNFSGHEKKKRGKKEGNPVLCPHLDYMYCPRPHCPTCQHNPDHTVTDARRPMIVVPAELQEAPKPKPLNERPPEERRDIQDQIGAAILEYKSEPGPGPVEKLLKIADSLGYREMWVYWRLTDDARLTVNIPLLHEIARVRGYKPGWVYFATKKVHGRKSVKSEYERIYEQSHTP
jgi:DNA repair protein RadD